MLFETGSIYPPMFTMPPRSSLWRRTHRSPYNAAYLQDIDDFEIIVPDEFWDPVVPENHDKEQLTPRKSDDYDCHVHASNSDFKTRERRIPIKIEHFRSNKERNYVTLDSSDDEDGEFYTNNVNMHDASKIEKYHSEKSRSHSDYNPREFIGHSRYGSKLDNDNYKQYSYVRQKDGRYRKYEMLSDDETDYFDAAAKSSEFCDISVEGINLSRNQITSQPSAYSSKKKDAKITADKYKCQNDVNDCLSRDIKHYPDDDFVDLTKDAESMMMKSNAQKTCKQTADSTDIVSPPSYPAYDIIRREISKFGGQVDYIRGDGNCFFRALSKVIYNSESFHEEMREAVVDFLTKYPKKFKQFVDDSTINDHIASMRKDGAWATQTEIYVTATMLQRDVFILSPDHTGDSYRWLLFSPQFKLSDGEFHPCHVTLCHTNGNHYDRIAPPSTKECNCGVPLPRLSGVETSVDLTDQNTVV